MVWRKITVETKEEAVDILSSYLYDSWDIEGVEIEDGKGITQEEAKEIFADILPEESGGEDAKLSFYLEILPDTEKKKRKEAVEKDFSDEKVDHSYSLNSSNIFTEEECRAILSDLRRELQEMAEYTDIGAGKITVSETEDKDWMNAWKAFFHSFRVGKVLIKPSWESVNPKEGEVLIKLDPGTSFGTGQHETTKLCLLALEKYSREGQRVLDLGTGSGILGIAALKMGALEVFATDLDPITEDSVAGNLTENALSKEQFHLFIENILGEEESAKRLQKLFREEPFDIVLANILAPVIIALAPLVPSFLKKGGVFITSGIIEEKAGDVRKALEAQKEFTIVEEESDGGWHSFVVKKI
ncbi:MAG: 50S ribosomal protein L11 methyltransferase [Lachnospiraceae bacterium]|nr:50S ribosomal protein L11 methyltransferase [Lachnospiraceae bacterium]